MGWKGWLVEGPVRLAGAWAGRGPGPAERAPRTILVLRPNDHGDLLTTTPIFDALRRRFPDSRIIAGVGHWGREIVENNPYVDDVVVLDAPWNNKYVADRSWGAVWRFLTRSEQVRALRARGGFDVGIDIMGSHVGAVLMLRLGVRYRVGVRGYRGGWSACQQYIRFSAGVHVARAALAQAELLGAASLPEARPQLYLTEAEIGEAERRWGGDPDALRILIGSAAGGSAKTWPIDQMSRFAQELSSRLRQAGRSFRLLVVGGAQDRQRGEAIVAGIGAHARSVCGETGLREVFALARQAQLVVSNSSMLVHAAAAFRRPTLVVLGGEHDDVAQHDALWGYPAPYRSIGATSGRWPRSDQVVAVAERMIAADAGQAAPAFSARIGG